MTTERRMQVLGITLGVAVAVLLIGDVLLDNDLSVMSRKLVMVITGGTFTWVTGRQGVIAHKYEGWPVVWPIAFRWVVCFWFAALALLVWWMLGISVWAHLFTTGRSTVVWLVLAEMTIFFLTRWVSVGRPQIAGPGETGSNH